MTHAAVLEFPAEIYMKTWASHVIWLLKTEEPLSFLDKIASVRFAISKIRQFYMIVRKEENPDCDPTEEKLYLSLTDLYMELGAAKEEGFKGSDLKIRLFDLCDDVWFGERQIA